MKRKVYYEVFISSVCGLTTRIGCFDTLEKAETFKNNLPFKSPCDIFKTTYGKEYRNYVVLNSEKVV